MQQGTIYSEPTDSDIRVSPFIGMTFRDLLMTFLVGAGVGLVTAGVALLMNKFVFSAVLCRTDAASTDCTNAPIYAMIVGVIIGAIAGLVALAQMRLYRPMLAVVAATVALWGFHVLTAAMPWYWALAVPMVLFGLVYALFIWVARIRSFILALVITVVLVVMVRFLLVA